eukprot:NODE_26873_length_534_cov_2.282555.p2 GENE.NODE_26873_length_534_cov_2.282555~~NODE_26873_length_534_cov_2.282555.p2  ORF type:complete len:153 (-),score=60.64 NODE_26873_length_534_cov_2.282555:75-533(-)
MGGLPSAVREKVRRVNETPITLHEAAKAGDLVVTKDLLTKMMPVHAQDLRGVMPLGYAIAGGNEAVVKLLLENRASILEVDSSRNTALHYAAGYGRINILEHLCSLGIDAGISEENNQRQTPMAVARANKQTEAMEFLQKRGAEMPASGDGE